MLDNSLLSIGIIYLLRDFHIVNNEQLKTHTLKVGDKPYFYSDKVVKQKHLNEINEYLKLI